MRPANSPRRNGGTIGGPARPLLILCILSIHVNIPPLSFPASRQCVPTDGDWQPQVSPGAPGTARQGPTRIIMLVNDGGVATQPKAPGHDRPFTTSTGAVKHDRPRAATRAPDADVPPATPAEAPGQYCLRAAHLAPGHDRPRTASSGATRHGRPRAAPRAPGADVPPATTAEAPGQHCLRAAHLAPGHDRPFTASIGAAKHDRPRAAPRAPGADVSPATPAEAPGQHRLRAAHLAPGHDRPRTASSGATRHGRPRAAPRAPGADVPLAAVAGAPGQHRLRAMANATVALPAGPHRLRQEGLPHNPANPRIHTHPHIHQDTAHAHARYRRATRHTQSRASRNPPLSKCWRGAGGEARLAPSPGACSGGGLGRGRLPAHPTTHQAHPAIQVPPHPRPCSTACTGFPLNHPARAPPRAQCVIAAEAAIHVPPQCGEAIV